MVSHLPSDEHQGVLVGAKRRLRRHHVGERLGNELAQGQQAEVVVNRPRQLSPERLPRPSASPRAGNVAERVGLMYIWSLANCASADSMPKSRFKMRQNSSHRPEPARLRRATDSAGTLSCPSWPTLDTLGGSRWCRYAFQLSSHLHLEAADSQQGF